MMRPLFNALVYLIVLVAIAHSLFGHTAKRAALLTGPGSAARCRVTTDLKETGL